jgi:hypothetical protein
MHQQLADLSDTFPFVLAEDRAEDASRVAGELVLQKREAVRRSQSLPSLNNQHLYSIENSSLSCVLLLSSNKESVVNKGSKSQSFLLMNLGLYAAHGGLKE